MRIAGLIAGVGLVVVAQPVLAGGFYIQEQNAAGVGRAQAGDVAAADDASTIYFNPAGMTELHGPEITLGADLLSPSASLTNTGSVNRSTGAFGANPAGGGFVPANGSNGGDPGSMKPVPHFYFATPLGNSGFSAGIGVSAPFGFISKYTPDSFARYDSTGNVLQTIDIAPSLAWKAAPWLSIGGGVDVQRAHVKLTTALPNPLLPGGPTPATDGDLILRGNAWTVGFNVGILFKPAPGTKIGVSYRSGISHNVEGTVSFSGLTGPLAARNGTIPGSAALDLPDIAAIGISQQVTDRVKLLAELDRYGWSNFKQIDVHLGDGSGDLVTPENYRNTWSVAVGGEYLLTDQFTLRAGIKWDETPTVNAFRDTRVPDGNRFWVAGGLGWKVTDHVDFDLGYTHIFVKDSTLNITRAFYATAPLPIPTTSTINATSHVKIDIVSLGLNYHF